MGKKVYSQKEILQLIKKNFKDLNKIYISNGDKLSLNEINDNFLNELQNFKSKFAYQPINFGEFGSMKAQIDKTFVDGIDLLLRTPLIINPNSFSDLINDNLGHDFIYNYFVLNSSLQFSLGIRFSMLDEVKDTYSNDDSFYILENEVFNKVDKTDFEKAVNKFHSKFDSRIALKGIGATYHVMDEVKYAQNIVQKMPTKITVFSTIYNKKLSFAGIATINGTDEYFNRGSQWP